MSKRISTASTTRCALFADNNCKRQAADSEDLVGTKCQIDISGSMIAVDYVREVSGMLRSRISLSNAARPFSKSVCQRAENLRADRERVQPERLNFHGLPMRGVISRPSTRASIQVSC